MQKIIRKLWTCLCIGVITNISIGVFGQELRWLEIQYAEPTNNAYLLNFFVVPGANKSDQPRPLANTGLAFDLVNQNLVSCLARYGNQGIGLQSFSRSGEPTAPLIQVAAFAVDLQGLAYDRANDSFWIWGGRSDNPKQRWIHQCDRDGNRIGDGFAFDHYPGMLTYDPYTDRLWAKPNDKASIFCLAKTTGNCEFSHENTAPGEGVAFDHFDETFWILNDTQLLNMTFIEGKPKILTTFPNPSHEYPEDVSRWTLRRNDVRFEISTNSGCRGIIFFEQGGLNQYPGAWGKHKKITIQGSQKNDGLYTIVAADDRSISVKELLHAEPSGAEITVQRRVTGEAEGITVDPADRTIWFNADQDIHGSVPNGNRCWHVDPLGNFGRCMYLPYAAAWTNGILQNGVINQYRLQRLATDQPARYLTPVFDRRTGAPICAIKASIPIACRFRGCDDPPDSTAQQGYPLPYYQASSTNQEGWGRPPPDWRQTAPTNRFFQIECQF